MAVVAVLVIAGLIGWGVLAGQENDNAGKLTTPPSRWTTAPRFAVGTGPVKVDVYEDFICPVCGEFEKTSAGRPSSRCRGRAR